MTEIALNEKIARSLASTAGRKPDDICYFNLIPEYYGQPFWVSFLNQANSMIEMIIADSAVPRDVSELVAAARMVTLEDRSIEAFGNLDKALQPFADRVRWDEEA